MARITILVLVALVAPVPARGQTGILHKHRSIAAPALPVSALPAASAATAPASTATAPVPVVCEVSPGTATVAEGLTVTTPSTTTSGAVGGWCNVVPGNVGDGAGAPPVVSLPSPIDGDGTVHIMPYPYVPRQIAPIDGDGIVHALPYPAMKPTSADGLPVGIEVASQMVAPQAFGLERAKVATTGFGGSMASARRAPLPAGLPAASGRAAGPAAGVRSGEGVVEARSAAPAAIQAVGQPTATPAPRWRDRLRFSWPGSQN